MIFIVNSSIDCLLEGDPPVGRGDEDHLPVQIGRRTEALPHLVPRREGGHRVGEGEDDHEAGQEDVLPLLPRDLQRGVRGRWAVQGGRQERQRRVSGDDQPHLRRERWVGQAKDSRWGGAKVPQQANDQAGGGQPGHGVPVGGPPNARDHLVQG